MNRLYFTSGSVSSFRINSRSIYVNLNSGEQISHSVDFSQEAYEIENKLIEFVTMKQNDVIGYFDYDDNNFGFIQMNKK